MPPPPKKLCVIDNIQTCPIMDSNNQGSTSRLQYNIDTILSQDILEDHAKVLFLFQCFREARYNQLCRDLVQRIYKHRHINLQNQILKSCHIASLGFFLSKSQYTWNSINLVNCNIREKGVQQLHQYFDARTDNSIVDEIDLSHNRLSHSTSPLLADVISWLQPHTLHLCNNCVLL